VELTVFRRDALRRPSFLYAGWLVVMMAAAGALYARDSYDPLGDVRPAVLLWFLVVTVHVLWRLRVGGVATLLAPDMLFLAIYSTFHHGYLVFWTLGIVPYANLVFPNVPTVPLSLFIINLGLLSTLVGFELFGSGSSPANLSHSTEEPAPAWGLAGFALMVVGAAMHVLTLLAVGLTVFMQHGYTAVARLGEYVGGPWPMLWARSTQVWVLGVTVYTVYSSLRFRKLFASKTPFILVVAMLGLFVLEGDRGPIFMAVLCLLTVRHYLIRPIRLYVVVAMAVGILTLFTAMKIARVWAFSPAAMVSEWQYARSTGDVHWWSAIAEAGASFRIACMTTAIVPDSEHYWYGASWLSAASKIIPFAQGRLSHMGLLREAPSQWITYEVSGSGAAGLGFSLPVEGYLNFGLPGVIFQMALIGALLRRVCVWFARRPSASTALIMLGIIAPTLKVVRDHISLVTHIYVQVIVLAWLFNALFGHGTRRGGAVHGGHRRFSGRMVGDRSTDMTSGVADARND